LFRKRISKKSDRVQEEEDDPEGNASDVSVTVSDDGSFAVDLEEAAWTALPETPPRPSNGAPRTPLTSGDAHAYGHDSEDDDEDEDEDMQDAPTTAPMHPHTQMLLSSIYLPHNHSTPHYFENHITT